MTTALEETMTQAVPYEFFRRSGGGAAKGPLQACRGGIRTSNQELWQRFEVMRRREVVLQGATWIYDASGQAF